MGAYVAAAQLAYSLYDNASEKNDAKKEAKKAEQIQAQADVNKAFKESQAKKGMQQKLAGSFGYGSTIKTSKGGLGQVANPNLQLATALGG